MSTPQDNRNGQGWNSPGAGQDRQGQQSPYGQSSDSMYSYPGTQPSGYAYPSQAGEPGRSAKEPAPKEVERAYYLILAAGVLSLLGSILSTLTTRVPDVAGASLGVGLGILFAVISTAIYVVLAVFIRRGQNWARITATVLAALSVLSTLSTFLLLPMTEQMAEASGTAIPETPALTIALGVVVTLLGVAGVAMTYLKPARPYFKPKQLGY